MELALGSAILSFLFPQVPKEFYRSWPIPGVVVFKQEQRTNSCNLIFVSRVPLVEHNVPICFLRDVMGRRAELNVSPPYPSLRDPYVSSTASTVFDSMPPE